MSTQQMTLPARYYIDPEIFRQELETFFRGMWVCAGREEQVANPADYFLSEVAGESIIVTRDSGGTLRAFYNVCRHRGTRMCREQHGKFSARIQCPYHGWTYGLDGRLLGAPHMDEATFRREDYPLHTVHVEAWDGNIFLNLSRNASPLAEQLADLPQKFAPWKMQELRVYKQHDYEVKANWKLIVLNYNECLHCPILHPLLTRITDTMSGDNDTPQSTYIGGSMLFRGAAQTMSMDGRRRRDYLPGLNEEQRKQVLYYAVYPNLLLSLHPDYLMAHRLWPLAPDLTRVICEWYFHPAEMAKPEFVAEDALEFWDKTNREDWLISELSQQGISSRAYTPGPYSPREGLPMAFDRMILERGNRG
jgi:phenylpropionate dioxygenase-like ring-hydroxylating dioxygenase large terminal subunit